MTLSRVKTWNSGDVLNAADLNAEFDNILNNPNSYVNPLTLTASPDFGSFQVRNFKLERMTGASTDTALARMTFNNTDRNVYVGNQGVSGVATAWPIGPQASLSKVRGLVGSWTTGTGAAFAALSYQLRSSFGGTVICNATSAYTINPQTAGPIINGRDQAAAFASTTVHFYAITTGLGSTAPQGLVSSNASPTPPTLPSGYTHWAYLGSANYTVASSGMTQSVTQVGSHAIFSTSPTLVSNGAATTETALACGGYVPQIATLISIQVESAGGICDAGGSLVTQHYVNSQPGLPGWRATINENGRSATAGVKSLNTGVFQILNANAPPTIYYLSVIFTGTSAAMSVNLVGYTVPNGDQ